MKLLLALTSVVILCSCVNQERNYKPAGFNSRAEAQPYIPLNFYLASKLEQIEWDAFYKKFPEYWKDIETARMLGSRIKYHPWYTAYAFRWNTLRRKTTWPPAQIERLARKQIRSGDDVFKIIYALGPPARVIWDNDFEILLYKNEDALMMKGGKYDHKKTCRDCLKEVLSAEGVVEELEDIEILERLELKRPEY